MYGKGRQSASRGNAVPPRPGAGFGMRAPGPGRHRRAPTAVAGTGIGRAYRAVPRRRDCRRPPFAPGASSGVTRPSRRIPVRYPRVVPAGPDRSRPWRARGPAAGRPTRESRWPQRHTRHRRPSPRRTAPAGGRFTGFTGFTNATELHRPHRGTHSATPPRRPLYRTATSPARADEHRISLSVESVFRERTPPLHLSNSPGKTTGFPGIRCTQPGDSLSPGHRLPFPDAEWSRRHRSAPR